MPNKCGETFPAEKKIQIREDIYQAAIEGDGFARYSVAHEVGHLLINDVDSISLCRLEPGEKLNVSYDRHNPDCAYINDHDYFFWHYIKTWFWGIMFLYFAVSCFCRTLGYARLSKLRKYSEPLTAELDADRNCDKKKVVISKQHFIRTISLHTDDQPFPSYPLHLKFYPNTFTLSNVICGNPLVPPRLHKIK